MAYQERFDEYKWGMIVGNSDNDPNKVRIIKKNHIVKEDFIGNLTSYPKAIIVDQDKDSNVDLTSKGRLESYKL